MSKDDYISRKEYLIESTKFNETLDKLILMDKENFLLARCRQNKVDFKKLKFLMDKFTKTESLVKKHNDEYVLNHLNIDKEYLESVLEKR